MSTSRFAAFAALILVLALPQLTKGQTPAPVQPAAPPPADPRGRFSGTFHWIGGGLEDQQRLAAVDRSADSLNFIIRGIARGRLRGATQIARNVTLNWRPGRMEVVYVNPNDHYRSSDDGATGTDTAPDGNTMQLYHRFENGNLVELRWSNEGSRRNYYMLSPDGAGLTVNVTMASGRLPIPVRYTCTYHR